MVQKSGVSIPVSEECIVAWADMPEPRRTPEPDEVGWDQESVTRRPTARQSSNTSDFVVISPQSRTASPHTHPDVCADARTSEALHGRLTLDCEKKNGQADERGTEQCVENCSKPADDKTEGEKVTEQRLARLERQAALFEDERPRVIIVNDFPPFIPAIPELRRVTWHEFNDRDTIQQRDTRYTIQPSVPAVEALIGGAYSEGANHKHNPAFDVDRPTEDNSTAHGSETYYKASGRIRINSNPILLILAGLLKQKPSTKPLVILHPFKVLVHYENEIRSILQGLEDKWSIVDLEQLPNQAPINVVRHSEPSTSPMAKVAHGHTQSVEPFAIASSNNMTCSGAVSEHMERAHSDEIAINASVPTTTRAEDTKQLPCSPNGATSRHSGIETTDSLEALRDLRCLVQFMEEDVKPLSDRFIDGTCSKVRFEDLWYLFKPGDDILAPFDHVDDRKTLQSSEIQQITGLNSIIPETNRVDHGRVWRVVQVDGKPHRFCFCNDDEDRWCPPMTSKPLKPYVVQCYCVDHDEYRYGPVLKCFEIRPFQGERDIKSLEIFPLRFAEDANEVKNMLKKRGQTFFDLVAKPQVRYYNGRTLGIEGRVVPVHLEGHVIVDFRAALLSFPSWSPSFADQCACDGARYPSRRQPVCRDERSDFLDHDAIQVDGIIDILRKEELLSSEPLLTSSKRLTREGSLPDSVLILLPFHILAKNLQTQCLGE